MTSKTISVTPRTLGVFHVDHVPEETIKIVNKFLQLNHDHWHILWNSPRLLHNHQVHFLLSDVALGATPDQIQYAFDNNKDYQRPIEAGDETRQLVINEQNFESSLGRHEYYLAWMAYFQDKISEKGWEKVVGEYLLARTARADNLLGRLFEGAIHPIIHLGFGVEFEQPAIIAEALAQAAIHEVEAGAFLLKAEKLAEGNPVFNRPLAELFPQARADVSIKDADCWKGGSFERNGNFFAVLPENLVDITAQYRLEHSEEVLTKRTAEMFNVIAWFTAAAQRPDKQAKFDFFYMHCVNCSIFLSVFANLSFLSVDDKIRLLEWKVRIDLVIYVCQGSPELRTDEIVNYKARQPNCMNWPQIIERAKAIPCDGHVVKMIRALNHGSIVSKPFEERQENEVSFPVRGNMWLKIANMVLDSTEDYPSVLDKWMRGPGFASAWDVVPDRK